MSSQAVPRVVLGTMTFGGQTDKATAAMMLANFVGSPLASVPPAAEIDTASMYSGGDTERMLGEILAEGAALGEAIAVATKANPFLGESLSPEGMTRQLTTSLASLRLPSVDMFYLHAADVKEDAETSLHTVQQLYEQGKFKRFALSNFTAWETVWIHGYMKAKGWVTPCVYQGMYNAITRTIEPELLPALRRLGMAFYAYNPLAGGMLTGKHTKESAATRTGGRFRDDTKWGKIYQERFMQDTQFEALEVVRAACVAADVPMAQAALRWMMHHSRLGAVDAVIIGASSSHHFDANMASCAEGPLPPAVVEAYDKAWAMCSTVAPAFSRGYFGQEKAEAEAASK